MLYTGSISSGDLQNWKPDARRIHDLCFASFRRPDFVGGNANLDAAAAFLLPGILTHHALLFLVDGSSRFSNDVTVTARNSAGQPTWIISCPSFRRQTACEFGLCRPTQTLFHGRSRGILISRRYRTSRIRRSADGLLLPATHHGGPGALRYERAKPACHVSAVDVDERLLRSGGGSPTAALDDLQHGGISVWAGRGGRKEVRTPSQRGMGS